MRSWKSHLVSLLFLCSSQHGVIPLMVHYFLFNIVLGSEMNIPPLLQTQYNDETGKAGLLVLVLS